MSKTFLKFFCVFFWGGIVISFTSLTYGQNYQSFQAENEHIRDTAKWRIGPFRIFPRLQLRNIGYDDNIYDMRKDNNPISDYTATLSPQANIYLVYRNWLIFSFLENPEYVYFFKEKKERSFNNTFSPGMKMLVFQRFALSGNYSYRKARRRASSEFDVRAEEKLKGYSGSFFYETARATSFGFSGSVQKINYEDTTTPGEMIFFSRALNREEKSWSFEFYYRIFSRSYFFLSGGATDYKFEHRESSWRDSYSYQAYSGIRFPLLGRARGVLSLGYKKLNPRKRELKGFSGLVGNTGLDFRIGRFGVRLSYLRDSYFSYTIGNAFFIENSYGSGISFYLTRFLRLDYDFTYGRNNYPEKIRINLPDGGYQEIHRQDKYQAHTFGLVIRIIRNTGLGLMINHWERDSNYFFESNRRRWFIGGYLTFEF
jgi:hypothetical protein